MQPGLVWAGSAGSYARLLESVKHNCECKPDLICPAHLMLGEQNAMNHMAWLEFQADRLKREESTR
jgi:hypothetical protein